MEENINSRCNTNNFMENCFHKGCIMEKAFGCYTSYPKQEKETGDYVTFPETHCNGIIAL